MKFIGETSGGVFGVGYLYSKDISCLMLGVFGVSFSYSRV